MARRKTIFQNPKSIAGTVLIGLGILILFANLAQAASQLSHLLGTAIENADTPSVLTTVGVLAGHAVQAYLFDHTEFLRGFHQILISFSALLLIITGTVFLQPCSR
jgi:putative Mn2+ efflux pump MntP